MITIIISYLRLNKLTVTLLFLLLVLWITCTYYKSVTIEQKITIKQLSTQNHQLLSSIDKMVKANDITFQSSLDDINDKISIENKYAISEKDKEHVKNILNKCTSDNSVRVRYIYPTSNTSLSKVSESATTTNATTTNYTNFEIDHSCRENLRICEINTTTLINLQKWNKQQIENFNR